MNECIYTYNICILTVKSVISTHTNKIQDFVPNVGMKCKWLGWAVIIE